MKKLPALLTLGLGLLPIAPAFAATIEDPQNLLKMLESGRTKSEFPDAFRLGDQITIRLFNTDCKWGCQDGCGGFCTTTNADFVKKVVEATADHATASSTDGSSDVYDRSEYETGGKQFLLKALQELDVYFGMSGKVVLTSLTPVDFALFDGTKIPAYLLKADFVAAKGSLEVDFTVSRGGPTMPGIAEILFEVVKFSPTDDGMKISKIKAVSRTP